MRKIIFKMILILIISFALSFIPYAKETTTINVEFLLTCSSCLFGIALAILALLFTIIDRYKEKMEQSLQNDVLERSLPVLKNIGDDVLGMFVVIVSLFITDLLSEPIKSLQSCKIFLKIDFERTLLLYLLIILLYITFDITFVVVKLINGLFHVSTKYNKEAFDLSSNERNIISSIRKLDEEHISDLLKYIKATIISQEMDKTRKK